MRSYSYLILYLTLSFTVYACKDTAEKSAPKNKITPIETPVEDKAKLILDYNTEEWSEITTADSMILDLRYATENNFTKTQIYDCARCFLRPEVAKRIRRINFHLHRKYNWRLKLFDCYRPRPYQQKLWDIVPNPIYVSDPSKGSMHNRGAAVDLTIVNEFGEELNMGTDFDHFGQEAHSNFTALADSILENRKILKDFMIGNGFKGIQSEWWHYSISGLGSELSEWVWSCETL